MTNSLLVLVWRTGSSLVPMWDTGVCNVSFPATSVNQPSPWWEAWFWIHTSFQGRASLRRSPLYLLEVIMTPCGTKTEETGQRQKREISGWRRRRRRGVAGRWEGWGPFEESRKSGGTESKTLKEWIQMDSREQSVYVPVCKWGRKHTAKWNKIRRWRSRRSSDERPGDI